MLADPGKEVPMADQAIGTRTRERGGRQWLRVFVVGLLLWVASVVVTFVTDNTNLVPTVILLGSFLVPVAFATYAFGRADQVVTAQRIFAAFVYGGVLGVLGASVLEAAFLKQPSVATYLGVGLVEEAVKLAALWLLALGLPRYSMRDGMVLGARPWAWGSLPWRAPGTPSTPCSPWRGCRCRTWSRPRSCAGC
jgi:protease PrsW